MALSLLLPPGEEECKRQQEPMVCPLCRAVWAGQSEDQERVEKEAREGQPSTSSPAQESRQEGGVGMETNRLETFQQKKERWKEVRFGALLLH